MGKTFRVRAVPRGWSGDDLQSSLREKASSEPDIGSLAIEVHGRTQTATLTFQDDSPQLEEIMAAKKLKIPLQLLGKQPTKSSSLVFDCDFNGNTTLYAPSSQNHRIDLIAISGLGGHAFGSFKERGGEHMWLRDALPYDITIEDNDTPISRVMIYGYDSSLQHSDSFQNMEDIGISFLSSLRSTAIAGSFRPIILVAHSLGGLIVKEILISLSKSDDERDQKLLQAVYGIAFFGVPHDGMDIQSLKSIVGNGSNRFLIESIGNHGSQILSIYQREFPRTLGGQGGSKVICFYETLKSPTAKKDERGMWKMTGPLAVLVSKSSATHCRPWENGQHYMCPISRTHSEMVKFSSEDHEYEKVRERIQSLVREALIAQKDALQPTHSQQAQDCLKSLAFAGMESRSLEIESAVSGTCEWLLEHETFKKWAVYNQELLWIKGKPVSGKSTLLNYAHTSQKRLSSAGDSDLVLSFFFHGRGNEPQKTPFGFFRSLLHQILKQMPNCLSDLVDTFERKCEELGKYAEKWQWHPKELWFALEYSILKVLETHSVWLFVDALDECGERNAKDLVQKFELLFRKSLTLSACPNQLRICFSCRHYPILNSPGLAEVCLEKENRADIDDYVMSEMSSSAVPISLFWIQSLNLVVKRIQKLGLDGAGPNEIKAVVYSIPEDLESLYSELIRGMGPASLKLIQWIYFATRPLSIEELRWALAIDSGYSSLRACQDAVDYIPDDKSMRHRIVSLSQGLAEIASGSDTHIIQFIHQSIKDFFLHKCLVALYGEFVSIKAAIGMSHLYLLKTCIRYLAMEEIGKSVIPTYCENQLAMDFPFLKYATVSWVSHMKQSDEHDIPGEQFLELFSWPSNALISLWARIHGIICHWSDGRIHKETSLVHIAARYGIQGVIKALQRLSQVTVEANSKDGSGQTPLSWTASKGHEAVVKLFLATSQADINIKDYRGKTPLSRAARNGHEAIVKLLLATGQVDMNIKDHHGNSLLLVAKQWNDVAIYSLLEQYAQSHP
ncbi:nacht and ankyrin domain-containing protein [Trichoderma austrokoningii]